jgi:hypothetical protein
VRDLQVLEMRSWREFVIDREKWRGIFRQAKPVAGCSANGRRRRRRRYVGIYKMVL